MDHLSKGMQRRNSLALKLRQCIERLELVDKRLDSCFITSIKNFHDQHICAFCALVCLQKRVSSNTEEIVKHDHLKQARAYIELHMTYLHDPDNCSAGKALHGDSWIVK